MWAVECRVGVAKRNSTNQPHDLKFRIFKCLVMLLPGNIPEPTRQKEDCSFSVVAQTFSTFLRGLSKEFNQGKSTDCPGNEGF